MKRTPKIKKIPIQNYDFDFDEPEITLGKRKKKKSFSGSTFKKSTVKKSKSWLKKGPWTSEEDQILTELVEKLGNQKWSDVARSMPDREGKQCRERWHNHLSPSIKKSPWSDREQWILFLSHKQLGNKWSKISNNLWGRTDNSIKNHWNSMMRKKIILFKEKLETIFADKGIKNDRVLQIETIENLIKKENIKLSEEDYEKKQKEMKLYEIILAERAHEKRLSSISEDSSTRADPPEDKLKLIGGFEDHHLDYLQHHKLEDIEEDKYGCLQVDNFDYNYSNNDYSFLLEGHRDDSGHKAMFDSKPHFYDESVLNDHNDHLYNTSRNQMQSNSNDKLLPFFQNLDGNYSFDD